MVENIDLNTKTQTNLANVITIMDLHNFYSIPVNLPCRKCGSLEINLLGLKSPAFSVSNMCIDPIEYCKKNNINGLYKFSCLKGVILDLNQPSCNKMTPSMVFGTSVIATCKNCSSKCRGE